LNTLSNRSVEISWANDYNKLSLLLSVQKDSFRSNYPIIETLMAKNILEDKPCVKEFVKTGTFFGLVAELLIETFDGIRKEGSNLKIT